MTYVDDWALLLQHHNTLQTDTATRCGADTQHANHDTDPAHAGKCRSPGEWRIAGYQREYCTRHAAVIVRANDLLWGGRSKWGRTTTVKGTR